jgi:hypothetical protein
MVDVQKCRLEVNHTFPDKEILALHVAKEANLGGINCCMLLKRPTYEGSTFFVCKVICAISNVMGPDFV